MKCTYEITIDGHRKVFNSSLELDAFLASKFENYFVDQSDTSLHVDLVQDVKNKILEIQDIVKNAQIEMSRENEDGEVETYLAIPRSAGATKVIKTYGRPDDLSQPLVTPFDETKYLDKLSNQLRSEGKTDVEIQYIIESTKRSWKLITDIGIDIHTIPESEISGTEKSLETLSQYLSDRGITILENSFEDFFEMVREKHGKNCTIMSEVPIVSKIINEVYSHGDTGIDSINGVIDLLVIDELGKVHIYDFKVSKKSVGDWNESRNEFIPKDNWSTTKKNSAAYQLSIYAAILRQWGLDVASTCIVPIKVNLNYADNDVDIESVEEAFVDMKNLRYFPNAAHHNMIISEILPVETLLDNVDLITAVQEPMTKFFPNYSVELQIQANTVSVERYINNSKIVHRLTPGEEGYNDYKWKVFTGITWKFVKTEDELRQVVTNIVNIENQRRGEEFATIASTLAAKGSLEDVLRGSRATKDYTLQLFEKYTREDSTWIFQNNPIFVAAGMFVFINNVTKKMEIISLHHNESHREVNLGKGTSLLGATKYDHEVDEHNILKATNGNIDLIKIMCVLNSLGDEVLNQYLITKISSHNIWHQTGSELELSDLVDNFSSLCNTHDVTMNLQLHNFGNIMQTTMSAIRDICGEDEYRHIGNFTLTLSPDNVVEGSKWILEKMKYLRDHYTKGKILRDGINSGTFDFNDPFTISYMMLGKALNRINGYNVYIEKDPGMWLDDRFATGLMINSPGNAPSLNVQTISQITSVAEAKIRSGALSYKSKIKDTLTSFYKYNGQNPLLGGEVKYFDNLFVKDEVGNIDKRFILRNPNDPDLAPEEAELIRVIADLFNSIRQTGYTEEDPEYYQVPLGKASRNTRRHKMGHLSEIKDYYSTQLNFLRIFPQQEENYRDQSRKGEVYNKYDIDQNSRNTLLENLDISEFETNLEILLWDYIISFERSKVMKEFLPRMQAVKMSLQYMKGMYGIKVENMNKYIDDYIKVNVYNQPIMDEKLQPYYKYAGVIRDVVSATSLGFNYRSGIREMVSGIWINLSRSMVNMYGHNHFNKSELVKAWTIICKDATKNPNILTLVDALNIDYQMANADIGQLQEQLSYSKSGIKNFDSDVLYIFSRVPDIYNRMGILVAQMIHDGCWEAHYVDENDNLIYDFKKDKRFSLLHDPNADKSSIEYRKQRGLYTAYREQFNREGYVKSDGSQLKDGDDLPRAYTIKEGTSIKSFADMCFGHYDKSSQMLMKHKFFGAFFLQFKTFLSAKAEQWVLKPGTYNQGNFAEKVDEQDNRVVRIYTIDANGNSEIRYDIESNVKEGEIWEPVVEWKGRFMEGMVYSVLDFAKKLYKLDFKGLQELWKNDTKRANLLLALHDMTWLSLIAAIITALLGDNDETVWGHGIVQPVVQALGDGNAYTIMTSMIGDINPAMLVSMKKIVGNTVDLLTGDKSLSKTLTSTFGSLSSLKYTIEEIV